MSDDTPQWIKNEIYKQQITVNPPPPETDRHNHYAEAALLGAVAGRMMSPGPTQADLDAATPYQREAYRKDVNRGRMIAKVFLGVLGVFVFFLLFVH